MENVTNKQIYFSNNIIDILDDYILILWSCIKFELVINYEMRILRLLIYILFKFFFLIINFKKL